MYQEMEKGPHGKSAEGRGDTRRRGKIEVRNGKLEIRNGKMELGRGSWMGR
jgi:hypothetical protein